MSPKTDIRQMALEEYKIPVRPGFVTGGTFWNGANSAGKHDGVKSRSFWNVHATQFMYPPCFEFTSVPCCSRFLFTATDCNKEIHTFEADSPMALLAPIWADLPEGYVELKVEALEKDGTPISLVGARTFYRCAPYAGPDAYPPKARSYRESALKAFRFVYNMPLVRYWLELMKNAHAYRYSCRMESYEWEGQFEDSPISSHYSNMSHYPADSLLYYIVENQKDDSAAIAEAEELMRFIEDQFVVWNHFAPRNRKDAQNGELENKSIWHSPAGMEQYNWYVPIDASTSHIMIAFLRLYKATGNPVLLAKACTLADSIMQMQNAENGVIPTHWVEADASRTGGCFWLNCCIETAMLMMEIANETEK